MLKTRSLVPEFEGNYRSSCPIGLIWRFWRRRDMKEQDKVSFASLFPPANIDFP
jgi:hypothetical protein